IDRYTDITWHHYDISLALFPDMKPLTYNRHEWNGSAWEYNERGTIVYDQYGGSVETIETNMSGTWENSGRFTISYDNHSNYTGEKNEQWGSNVWVLEYQEEEALTYNANLDITERVYLRDVSGSGTLETNYKVTYDDFQYVSSADQ